MSGPSKAAKASPGAAVTSEQLSLWESSDPLHLDLRQVASEMGLSGRALEIVASAETIEDAMDQLCAAGLLPSEEESRHGLVSWFTPLLEPDCDQLDADMACSAFLGAMRSAAPADLPDDELALMLSELIAGLRNDRRPEVLAMCRVLAATGPVGARTVAADAAKLLISSGLSDVSWAAGLGQPEPGPCFGYGDVYGEQVSIMMCFKYGQKPHAVAVLIDHVLGGGIKDCWVTDQNSNEIRHQCRSAARDPEISFFDLDGAQARAIVTAALAEAPCPVEPDQVEGVVENLDLVRARMALLPEPGPRTPSSAGTVHRIKVTLHGTKPPIWRRFEVPSDISLEGLHGVLQVGFSWLGDHMWLFETPAGQYGMPGSGLGFRSAEAKKLSSVAAQRGDRIRYEYDFGDSWVHDIVIEDVGPVKPGVEYPRCTAGRRAAPPDDCGGVSGYWDLLEILADPGDDQHAERLEWLGLASADEFDPALFDVGEVNEAMRRLGVRA